MFRLDLEDDKLAAAAAAGLTCSSPNGSSYSVWSHYTSRLPSPSAPQPLRPATASPSFHRTSPLPCSPSVKQPLKYGSAQQPQRASLSPTIPTLSSRMRSSTVFTPTGRAAVPSPSARLIKALPLSPAASTTSSSSCVSQCSSASEPASDDDFASLDCTFSPSLPSPASPIALLTAASASHSQKSPLSIPFSPFTLPVPPALPRASTLPTTATKAQQWRSEKGMSVQAGGEVKRASMSNSTRAADEHDIGTYIFELEL